MCALLAVLVVGVSCALGPMPLLQFTDIGLNLEPQRSAEAHVGYLHHRQSACIMMT